MAKLIDSVTDFRDLGKVLEGDEVDEDVDNDEEEEESSSEEDDNQPTFETFDSSDEEDIRNTIGNVPISWYDDEEHVGYDWEGKKLARKTPKRGEIDEFMARMEDPDYWRKVKNPITGEEVRLTDEQVQSIQNMQKGKNPEIGYNPYQDWVDLFSSETMIHPVTDRPEHKRSFIPSRLEKAKVSKMVHAIKMGWMKPKVEKEKTDEEEITHPVYDLWAEDKQGESLSRNDRVRMKMKIPAPKMTLPDHSESYNPPPEYLLTEEERKKWEEQEEEERKRNFVPEKYCTLRHVPSYPAFVNERFERCLDLYLAPRQRKMRLNVNPDDLLPKLPKPEELRPFPTNLTLVFKGHTSFVRCISIEPERGQYIASGSDDKTIRIWELASGRCLSIFDIGDTVNDIEWCPNSRLTLLAAAVGKCVVILNAGVGDKLLVSDTRTLIASLSETTQETETLKWKFEPEKCNQSLMIKIYHDKEVNCISWQTKGDYLASVCKSNSSDCVTVHQLSKLRSQFPFSKPKGIVQKVLFHPSQPHLYVATQKTVRVYNLTKQQLSKKLLPSCRYISSMALHPKGDNLIVGSYDCRLNWFDLDLSSKPYKTLKHHRAAVRGVDFHRHYPLFATCSDDGSTIICHGRVFSDLMQNALIVPVKMLRGHGVVQGLGVLACKFHPTRPWIVTAAADSTIRLWTD